MQRIRHISTSEDVKYKQVNHQIFVQGREDGGTNKKYLPVNEALLLPIYQVEMVGSPW